MKEKKTKVNKPEFPLKGCGIRGAKKERHKRKGRGENGRTKTKTCQANWMQRGACKANRSYKQSTYATTMRSIDRKAGRVPNDETAGLGKRSRSGNSALRRRIK